MLATLIVAVTLLMPDGSASPPPVTFQFGPLPLERCRADAEHFLRRDDETHRYAVSCQPSAAL